MEFVLQKGTELGVAEFWPFEAERSVPRLLGDADDDGERATQRANRWRRIVEAACAQCGRAQVPIVHAIGDFATAVSYGTSGGRCFMLDEDPQAPSLREVLTQAPLFEARAPSDEQVRIMLLIGPEGWLGDARTRMGRALWSRVSWAGAFGFAHRNSSFSGGGDFAVGSRRIRLVFG